MRTKPLPQFGTGRRNINLPKKANTMQKQASLVTGAATLLVAALTLTAGSAAQAQQKGAPTKAAVQTARVLVTEKGYQPASLTLKNGVPARVTFVRTTDATCATSVLLPDYKVTKALPLNKPVVVAFTPKKSGTYAFTCGMKMFKGKVVVK